MSPKLRYGALAIAAAGAATLLAGCGKMGALDRPGPMFGAGRGAAPQAETTERQDPTRPVNTVDPRDVSATPGTVGDIPIRGTNDPNRPAPQGALPDPMRNPG